MLRRHCRRHQVGRPIALDPRGFLLLFEPILQRGGALLAEEILVVGAIVIPLDDLYDVVAVRGFHQVADLAGLQGESGLLKGIHHPAPGEPPQVSTLVLGALVGAVFAGELSEVLSVPQSLQHFLCQSLVLQIEQDMASVYLLPRGWHLLGQSFLQLRP